MGTLAIDLAQPFLRSHPTLSSGRIDPWERKIGRNRDALETGSKNFVMQ